MFLFSISFLTSCGGNSKSREDGKVAVSGEVLNAPSGILTIAKFVEGRPNVLDTLELNTNGEFSYELEIEEPSFYDLNLFGQKSIRLALLDEDVHVRYDFSQPENMKIEGSKDTQEMLKIDTLMNAYQAEVNALNQAYYDAMSANDGEAIKQIQHQALELEANQSERVRKAIQSMDGSFASLAAIGLLNPKNDFSFLDKVISELHERFPNSLAILQLKQQMDELRALAIGAEAPEITLPDPDGNSINLSDLRGKYVLIDFWAAWCKPCRVENPNVVRLYNTYKDKGFEVFGVSLDRTKKDWVKAIEDDQLTWIHVSDLQYFNSAAAQLYQIQAIPATYLIDPEGNIIAKDLRGPTLERKLAELFD